MIDFSHLNKKTWLTLFYCVAERLDHAFVIGMLCVVAAAITSHLMSKNNHCFRLVQSMTHRHTGPTIYMNLDGDLVNFDGKGESLNTKFT